MLNFILTIQSLYILCMSLEMTLLPSTGTPPTRSILSTTSYNPLKDEIILFGGATENYAELLSSLHIFNLKLSRWSTVIPQSSLVPPGIYSSFSFCSSDGKFFLLFGKTEKGISSDVYSFDFNHLSWEIVKLSGDSFKAAVDGASCHFEYNGKTWFAIYGGVNAFGESQDLILIDVEELKSFNMPYDGETPGKRVKNSLSFYDGALYLFGDENSHSLSKGVFFKYSLEEKRWNRIKVPDIVEGRKLHYSTVFEDSLYIFYGFSQEDDCYSILIYNFLSLEWTSQNEENFSYGGSSILISSNFYIFLGSSDKSFQNSLVLYDLSKKPLTSTSLISSYKLPHDRKNHASFAMETCVYIFGGFSPESKYLNDLWSYDTITNTWTEVEAEGSVPHPRELMGATVMEGIGLLVAGGRSSDQIFSDFYMFNYKSKKWINLSKSTFEENPHYGSCLGIINLTIILFGGRNSDKVFRSVRIYDLYEKTETEIEFEFEDEIIDYCCHFIYYLEYVEIYVIGGSTTFNTPNNKVYKIKVTGFIDENYTASLEEEWNFKQLPSQSSFVYSNGYVYMLGGTFHGDFVSMNLTSFYLKDPDKFGIKTEKISNDLAFFSHSAALIGRSIYVFGGVYSTSNIKLSNQGTNRFYEIKDIYNTKGIISCSYGVNNPNCLPCSKGYYFEDQVCTPCPAGKHSTTLGAKSIEECIPCPNGSFSDTEGSSLCKLCPYGTSCPIGSHFPKNNLNIEQPYSIQPKHYDTKTNYIQNIFYIISMIGFGFLFILLIFLIYTKRFRSFLINIDLFVDKHNNDLGVPVIHRKTLIGGIFSSCFLLFVSVTLVSSLMSFLMDNISEVRSLVPKLTQYDSAIAKSFYIKLRLYEYGGICSVKGECFKDNNYTQIGFDFQERQVVCYEDGEDCMMEINYKSFTLNTDGKIFVHLKDMTAYASSLGLHVAVSSSVPGENSLVFIPLHTPSSDVVFKGLTASRFSVEFIPSIFESDSTQWDNFEYGYHVSDLKDHSHGSTTDIHHFNNQFYLLVEIDLKLSNLGFTTKRNVNSTWMIYFAAVIGSIFGVMQSFGGLMAFTEKFVDKYKEKRLKKIGLNYVNYSRKTLKSAFNRKFRKSRYLSISPTRSKISPEFEISIV